MADIKQRVRNFFRYPLMWVMLLWALTLPGHEVVVYNFMLDVLSGKAPAALLETPRKACLVEHQIKAIPVFQDAAPASMDESYLLHPVHLVSGSLGFIRQVPVLLSQGYWLSYKACPHFFKFLRASILPNAP